MSYSSNTETVIIGAGPFGLSIAAHLRGAGAPFRIFGKPMDRWLSQMPVGMFLKSEGRASSLSDPAGRHTLARFCADNNLPYDDRAMPVSLDTFTRYAMSFQRELVPNVEEVMVSRVDASPDGFTLKLENGEILRTRNVIVATGLEHTVYVPPVIRYLPQALRSHSSEHTDLSRFAGKDVTLIGAGQSSLETAALLSEAGAQVRVIARKPAVAWNDPPRLKRSLYHKLRYPLSDLGEGLQVWLYSKAPNVFSCLPLTTRITKVKTVLDAAGACWLRSRVEGKTEILTGRFITNATVQDGRVALKVADRAGNLLTIMTDHVIAATGYRYDLQKLSFLSDRLKERLQTEDKRPRLNRTYESTVPHLYFTGIASAYQFGPSMRFIAGVGYAARVISGHIAQHQQKVAPQETRIAAASVSR